MALIQCSECGKEISDKAKKCPNCGCPIGVVKDNEHNEQKKTKKGIRYILFLIIGIALICFVIIGVSVFYKEENEVSINEPELFTEQYLN